MIGAAGDGSPAVPDAASSVTAELLDALGARLDPELLERALTHRSFAYENGAAKDRLMIFGVDEHRHVAGLAPLVEVVAGDSVILHREHARLLALQDLLAAQQRAFNAACAGRTLDVLFEKTGRQSGQAIGRSPYLQPVHVDGAAGLIGQIHPVRIEAMMPNSLRGALGDARESMAAR